MSEYRRAAMHIIDTVPSWTPDEEDDFLVAFVLSDHSLRAWDGAAWSVIGGSGSQAFPVGSIYTNVTGVNPGTELGYGTWSAFGNGRVLVGYDSGDTDFDTAEETGGEKTHVLTEAEMPNHNHTVPGRYSSTGSTGLRAGGGTLTQMNTGNAGSDNAHNNVQPYIVVHFWKRTA